MRMLSLNKRNGKMSNERLALVVSAIISILLTTSTLMFGISNVIWFISKCLLALLVLGLAFSFIYAVVFIILLKFRNKA